MNKNVYQQDHIAVLRNGQIAIRRKQELQFLVAKPHQTLDKLLVEFRFRPGGHVNLNLGFLPA